MAFFMLAQPEEWNRDLASSILDLREQVSTCSICGGIAVGEICAICTDESRDKSAICVVETQEDCVAIEQSGVFSGTYHVLGGRCSPLEDEHIPEESLDALRDRVSGGSVKEVILALDPRVEGDMTAFEVKRALAATPVHVTRLAYGLPVGGSIGFADRMTLHVALESRREVDD